jgi:hypothetical protein
MNRNQCASGLRVRRVPVTPQVPVHNLSGLKSAACFVSGEEGTLCNKMKFDVALQLRVAALALSDAQANGPRHEADNSCALASSFPINLPGQQGRHSRRPHPLRSARGGRQLRGRPHGQVAACGAGRHPPEPQKPPRAQQVTCDRLEKPGQETGCASRTATHGQAAGNNQCDSRPLHGPMQYIDCLSRGRCKQRALPKEPRPIGRHRASTKRQVLTVGTTHLCSENPIPRSPRQSYTPARRYRWPRPDRCRGRHPCGGQPGRRAGVAGAGL